MNYERYSALDQAKYNTVHDFIHPSGRGAAVLGPIIGVHPGTLCNKVNPDIDTHHLSVDESVRLQIAAKNFAIHEAQDRLFGRVSIAVGPFGGKSNGDLCAVLANCQREDGETAEALLMCLERAPAPSEKDLQALEREIYEDIQVRLELLRRVRALRHG